jgi:hypothetical protein
MRRQRAHQGVAPLGRVSAGIEPTRVAARVLDGWAVPGRWDCGPLHSAGQWWGVGWQARGGAMRITGRSLIFMAVWIVVALIAFVAEPVEPIRGPLLIGLVVVLCLGLYVESVVSELRQSDDERNAEAIMRERRPGWENLPAEYREEWEEERAAERRHAG